MNDGELVYAVMIIIAIVVFTIWWINNKKQAEYIKSNSERYKGY